MTPNLKALALAAVEEKQMLDAGAYSSSGRELARAKIDAFHDAATPERILHYENEVLEKAANRVLQNIVYDDTGLSSNKEMMAAASVIRSLKTKEPT